MSAIDYLEEPEWALARLVAAMNDLRVQIEHGSETTQLAASLEARRHAGKIVDRLRMFDFKLIQDNKESAEKLKIVK